MRGRRLPIVYMFKWTVIAIYPFAVCMCVCVMSCVCVCVYVCVCVCLTGVKVFALAQYRDRQTMGFYVTIPCLVDHFVLIRHDGIFFASIFSVTDALDADLAIICIQYLVHHRYL